MADKDVITAMELCANISQDGCMMLCPYKDDQDETYPGLCEHIMKQDALELLKSQQAEIERLKEQQPKWIPINERKPNSCGVYIVARWFIDGCRRKILTDACYFDGSNTWHDDTRVNHSRPYLTDKIVAWMPLPNPPEDGEQE